MVLNNMLVLVSNNMLFIVVGVVFDTMGMRRMKTARIHTETRGMVWRLSASNAGWRHGRKDADVWFERVRVLCVWHAGSSLKKAARKYVDYVAVVVVLLGSWSYLHDLAARLAVA